MRQYVLQSEFLEVKFLDLGGRITSIKSPFFDGNLCLAYPEETDGEGDSLPSDSYKTDNLYLGAVVGRYANRIANAAFTLDGVEYKLDKNDNGKNCLHGGYNGYDRQTFKVDCSHSSAILSLTDREGIFPGNVDVKIKYYVLGSSLMVTYLAKTDKPTVINLTNHTYFNPNGDIDDCEAVFNADYYTPVDKYLIPTGEITAVDSTPFDFREYKRIGRDINHGGQLDITSGYDHNFIINGEGLRQAAKVYMPDTGMTLTVTTDMPGFQFYTGNFLDGYFSKREGFCIETQYYPDTPNKPAFPSCVITPEKPFRSKTVYTFSQGKA